MRITGVFLQEIRHIINVRQPKDRDFRANFGVSLQTIVDVWVDGKFKKKTKPKHILWALLFLKTYATEDRLSRQVQVDRKTFRKWLWPTIKSIADLHLSVVSLISLFYFNLCVSIHA